MFEFYPEKKNFVMMQIQPIPYMHQPKKIYIEIQKKMEK